MKLLVPQEDALRLKYYDTVPCECVECGNAFNASAKTVKALLLGKPSNGSAKFCSLKCSKDNKKGPASMMECTQCKAPVMKKAYQIVKTKNIFCSHSCNATYQNANKTTGTRRSKLEVWLETKLNAHYPGLDIMYCDKSTIKSELDIFFPTLNIAFELNGIYHYEPIYGQDKLDKIQSNDDRKFQACLEHGIELVIIDTSKVQYVKEKTCSKFFDIITMLVDRKRSGA